MKERPILFSAPMVRAILAGTKTQTRRVVKPQPGCDPRDDGHIDMGRCPYGQPGDGLWVKETFAIVPRTAYRRSEGVQQTLRPDDDHDAAIYRAGWDRSNGGFRWRPSIHMPRWASRITLEITGVRVERLQDISPSDAIAEGLKGLSKDGGQITKYGIPDSDGLPGTDDAGWPWHAWRISPVDSYRRLWSQINGPRSWDANPFVWVVEFKRVTE